jgi:hypothetical protein
VHYQFTNSAAYVLMFWMGRAASTHCPPTDQSLPILWSGLAFASTWIFLSSVGRKNTWPSSKMESSIRYYIVDGIKCQGQFTQKRASEWRGMHLQLRKQVAPQSNFLQLLKNPPDS